MVKSCRRTLNTAIQLFIFFIQLFPILLHNTIYNLFSGFFKRIKIIYLNMDNLCLQLCTSLQQQLQTKQLNTIYTAQYPVVFVEKLEVRPDSQYNTWSQAGESSSSACLPHQPMPVTLLPHAPRTRYTSSPFATRRRDKSNITRTGVNTQNVYLQLETSVPISVAVMLTLMQVEAMGKNK